MTQCRTIPYVDSTEIHLPDILDQLNQGMDDPDLSDMLAQSIEHEFHLKYPQSTIVIYSTDNPVTMHVQTDTPPTDYYMVMTDEWVDQTDWRFTFTRSTDHTDQITVNLADA